jgi:hypothetical protein
MRFERAFEPPFEVSNGEGGFGWVSTRRFPVIRRHNSCVGYQFLSI